MENYHSNLDLTFDLEPFLILRIFSPEGIGDEKQPYLQTTQSMASLFVSNFFSRINQTSPFHKFIYLFLYISLDSYQTLDSTFYIFLGNLPNQTQEHIRYALYFLFHAW